VPKEKSRAGGRTTRRSCSRWATRLVFASAPGAVAIDSAVSLLPAGNRALKLGVSLPSVGDRETAAQLVREAHQVCPSNATRGNIDAGPLLGGEPV
jgi:hypothetical protein